MLSLHMLIWISDTNSARYCSINLLYNRGRGMGAQPHENHSSFADDMIPGDLITNAGIKKRKQSLKIWFQDMKQPKSIFLFPCKCFEGF